MSLRGNPVVERVGLPDGRELVIRVAVPDDPYIAKSELDTVTAEIAAGDDPLGSVTTPFDPDDSSAARHLAREIRAALERLEIDADAEGLETVLDRVLA